MIKDERAKPDKGAIDLQSMKPRARGSAEAREDAERQGLEFPDGRSRGRRGRSVAMSFKFKPETKALIHRIAESENKTYVEIVEEALELYNKYLKGD